VEKNKNGYSRSIGWLERFGHRLNARFYSIELVKRGTQVTIDLDEHYLKQATWVAEQFGLPSKITFKMIIGCRVRFSLQSNS